MVRIAISQAAFEAIAKTLPLGSVNYENATNERGERLIWLERRMLDKLNSYRRSWGELQRRDLAAGGGGVTALGTAPPRKRGAYLPKDGHLGLTVPKRLARAPMPAAGRRSGPPNRKLGPPPFGPCSQIRYGEPDP
jgi:hypothetical protein